MAEAEGNTRAASFFEDCFGEDGKPVGRNGYPFTTEYNGHEMMSDGNWLVTTFTVQFPWFAVKGMHDNKFWSETVYPSWAAAERDYWSPSGGANVDWAAFDTAWGVSGTAGHAFGCGAGDSPASYMVQSMDGSAYNIFSAANMAPFMSVDDQVEADLNWLYDNDVAYVKSFKDGSTAKLLWRYSGLWTWWRASTVTSVDYSTMVMEYALKHLPEDFYPMHNSCILNEPTTTTPPTTTTSTTTTTTTTTEPTTSTPTTETTTTATTTTKSPWNEDVCAEDANKVDYWMKSNHGTKVLRAGEHTYLIKLKMSQADENNHYTMFLTWGKKNCGVDFIEKLGNGGVMIDLMDKSAEYKFVGKHTGMRRHEKHYNTVFQFENNALDCEDCLGSSTDQIELMIHFIDPEGVDWGNKDPLTCLGTLRAGYAGAFKAPVHIAEDVSPCVAWDQKFW